MVHGRSLALTGIVVDQSLLPPVLVLPIPYYGLWSIQVHLGASGPTSFVPGLGLPLCTFFGMCIMFCLYVAYSFVLVYIGSLSLSISWKSAIRTYVVWPFILCTTKCFTFSMPLYNARSFLSAIFPVCGSRGIQPILLNPNRLGNCLSIPVHALYGYMPVA